MAAADVGCDDSAKIGLSLARFKCAEIMTFDARDSGRKRGAFERGRVPWGFHRSRASMPRRRALAWARCLSARGKPPCTRNDRGREMTWLEDARRMIAKATR